MKLPGTAEALLQIIKDENIEFISLRFCDALSRTQTCTYASRIFSVNNITNGIAFDSSSIPIFSNISQADMLMVPDLKYAFMDDFSKFKTIILYCDVKYPDGKEYEKCPRSIAKKAAKYLVSTGIADVLNIGPEMEFFLLNSINYKVSNNHMFSKIDGVEGEWNVEDCSCNPHAQNLGHRVKLKQNYLTSSPIDTSHDIRGEMLMLCKDAGIEIEKHHHEVASNQVELGIIFNEMIKTADSFLTMKYIVKNVALRHGKTATFMPKPLAYDNGSGLHCNLSLWKARTNTFYDENEPYARLSQTAKYFIGGLLHHAPSLCSFTNPTVNSYKRLVPGFEAPTSLVYSKANRSAAIRIPMANANTHKYKRAEYRCPDSAICPYLAFAGMLLAGIDGIKKEIDPGNPYDCDMFATGDSKNIRKTPRNLHESLNELERDNDYLKMDNVFSEEFLTDYIKCKRIECNSVDNIPHPKEFELYFHV